jgi:glutamate 5-kinase
MKQVSQGCTPDVLPFRRLVIKLGTTLLTAGTPRLSEPRMSALVGQIAELHKRGAEIVMVSSGAVAAGREKFGVPRKVKGLPLRQVMAAIGQSRLMGVYDRLFDPYKITLAQALLTRGDLSERVGYLNARNTFLALIELGVIGIVNENDVVAVDELHEGRFGDNDNLSAMVANLIDADLLLILSDISGLYTDDPNLNPDAKLIPVVERITEEIDAMVGGTAGNQGTGGMITKIEAAKTATACGATVIIASGREPDVILRAASGDPVGTRFLPAATARESRERWMLSGLAIRGRIVVDEGALAALERDKRSLLAAGIVVVEGDFERGDLVDVFGPDGGKLGTGISNYGSTDLGLIKGAHSDRIGTLLGHDYGSEVIHRNNLVLL